MASDFFYPNMGGVEEHIFNLSQCLIERGHKVVIMTHAYGDRNGIRYMTNGLKVYYIPIRVFYNQSILPTMICNIPLIRYILIREQIDIVHGHSAFSAFAHEVITVGKLLGMRAVFTDHSLFGFADLSAVVTNKFLEIGLSTCNHCICVSHTGKENTVLRARVPKDNVSVIPNAVDTTLFTPNPIKRPKSDQSKFHKLYNKLIINLIIQFLVNIVIISRLVYRKGVDLLAAVIPKFHNIPNVHFIIGGDGPKRGLLEETREKSDMQNRVTMLGALEHSKVRNILVQGHIFLNTSLTEAFCMAIVEAAACGLQVVSTKVGGIPEVLPKNFIILTEPNVEAVYQGLLKAIKIQNERQNMKNVNISKKMLRKTIACPFGANKRVSELYNWGNVAERTELVYEKVLKEPDVCLGEKLNAYLHVWPFVLVISLMHILLKLLDWWSPRAYIDIAKDFSSITVKKEKTKKK